ncbi:tetratricopeptide repeat protein [Arcobacter venerupis]|uniref:Tetratricopeptide repeat protein n=1 Tax=Arcobacter venerupis TaxID=1054033 RepID=A0AAE7E588_9BACT|nr:tetratricopeptide repeat protein [Arcobacter venerupis]QKF67511.1 tetratricopeptide repeat protein [Arcobacter venerupis]RWS50479.1 hypothetical protein CKA56_02805 [Arcobacter venerupis]
MYLKTAILLSSVIFLEADNEIASNNKNQIKKDGYSQIIEDSNEYITASIMYKIQDYQKAYDKFFKLFQKNPHNTNVNYFLALSALKLDKYDEATATFERILIQNPEFNQARYEYAKLLYKLNLKNEAKKEFTILSKSNIKDETKESITKYLDLLNEKTFFVNATILLGVGRSTNINTGLISPEYRLPGLNDILVNGEKPIADNYHNEMFGINFLNNFKDSSFSLKNSILVYNKNYFNNDKEDLTAYVYKPSFSYLDSDKKNLYSLNFGLTRLDKRDNEDFNIFNIGPSIMNSSYYASVNYQRFSYLHESDKEKDFDKYELLLKYKLLSNLNIYSKLAKSIRVDSSRVDLDKNSVTAGLEYIYEINKENSIKFDSEYIKSYYKYENTFFDSKRKDDNYYLGLSYLTKIDKENQIVLSSSFTKNYSNQDGYIYEEVDGKISYIKTFNW